jgi:cell division protein FtsB
MSDKDVQPRLSPYLRPVPPAAHLARSTVSLLIVAGIVLLILSTTLGPNGLVEYMRLRQERDQLLRDQAALRVEVVDLEARLQALRSDPFALEKLARERYNMRRPDEQVILLVPDPLSR